MKICMVVGCTKNVHGHGLCKLHHKYWRAGKDLGITPVPVRRKNGEGTVTAQGYLSYNVKGIPTPEHRLIAERVLGRPLKGKELVHHVNGIRIDNKHDNLIICPDDAYHALLHMRQRALDVCGNPDWRKCAICKIYDSPTNMTKNATNYKHGTCTTKYIKERYGKRSHQKKETAN